MFYTAKILESCTDKNDLWDAEISKQLFTLKELGHILHHCQHWNAEHSCSEKETPAELNNFKEQLPLAPRIKPLLALTNIYTTILCSALPNLKL